MSEVIIDGAPFDSVYFTPVTGVVPSYIADNVGFPPNSWKAVGGSGVDAVKWTNQTGWSNTRFSGIMDAWSGGAYDAANHRLLIHGGGHVDYDGNEIYAFRVDLNSWVRLTDPSASAALQPYASTGWVGPPSPPGGILSDGAPMPIHTYNALQVHPPTGKFYRLAGGGGIQGVKQYTPSASVIAGVGWAAKALPPASTEETGTSSAYDPVTDKFYHVCRSTSTFGRLSRYDPVANTWVLVTDTVPPANNAGGTNYYTTCAIDPTRRLLVIGGSTDLPTSIGVHVIGSSTVALQATTGPAPNMVNGSLMFRSRDGCFYAMNKLGQALSKLTPSASPYTAPWTWTTIAPGAGATLVAGYSNGIYGRFQYCSDYDVFVMASTVLNTYLYKPAGWTPPP